MGPRRREIFKFLPCWIWGTGAKEEGTEDSVDLTFWGVRGSFPVAQSHVRRFGGNTSCIALESQGHHLIIDAGTGIRKLGEHLVSNGVPSNPLTILISHTHWDHIQGFPFFAPAYSERFSVTFHSVHRPVGSLRELLSHQQDQNFFPIPLGNLKCELDFLEMEENVAYEVGPFSVKCLRLNHPGISSGFRIECGGAVLAYVSDVAPSRDNILLAEFVGNGNEHKTLKQLYENQLALADGADAVIYDTMFTPEQYRDRKHWGHSTPDDGARACKRSRAGSMFLFHHNPDTSDDEQEQLLEEVRKRHQTDSFGIEAAREGTRWRIASGGATLCE